MEGGINRNVKNIIFDLGGVILNIDYKLTIQAFQKLGISNFENIYTQAQQNDAFDNLETGRISKNEFLVYIKSKTLEIIKDEDIISAWNAMLLDLPYDRVKELKKLSTQFNLYLLSNTNEIHLDSFKKTIDSQYGDGLLESIFKNIHYSHEISLRKPNKEVFEFVLNENGLKKDETIFFDDSIQHVNGANAIELYAYLISEEKPFSYYLSDFLS